MLNNISGFSKRSIATQTGNFAYEFSVNLSNTTGSCSLGFSGSSGNVASYSFVSGKIYDSAGRNIYSYQSGTTVNINGVLSPSGHNIYTNFVPTEFAAPFTAGPIDYFYVSPSGCVVNSLDLYFSGNAPKLGVSGVSFSGGNSTGSGVFSNGAANNSFRIFSGYDSSGLYLFSGSPYTNITSSAAQNFYIVQNFQNTTSTSLTDNTVVVPYTFYTNFGTFTTGLSMTTVYPIVQTLFPSFNSITGSGLNTHQLNWQTYKGSSQYTLTNLPAYASLTWVSGAASGNFSGTWAYGVSRISDGAIFPMSYSAAVTGYTGFFTNYGIDGIYSALNRLIYSGDAQVVKFTYSGYNTGYSVLITGN